MMRLCPAGGHELFASLHWKRQVREAASVQVAKLAPANLELHAAEPVRLDAHARPACDFLLDEFSNVLSHSDSLLSGMTRTGGDAFLGVPAVLSRCDRRV